MASLPILDLAAAAFTQIVHKPNTKNEFDPEGQDYDYDAAMAAGMGPTGKGENIGHWGSVREATDAEKEKHGLPSESYLMLKGKSHESWDKAVAGEEERGFTVKKFGDRYYSIPNEQGAE